MTTNERDNPSAGSMKIDIGQISSAGHVVIAGGNATVSGGTRGDGSDNDVVMVGGVEATQEEAIQLRKSLDTLDRTVENAKLEPAIYAAAKYNVATLKEQISSQAKPNEHLMVQAAEALYQFGPEIAGAVVAAFTTPLAGKIVAYAGERALSFYRKLVGASPETSMEPIPPSTEIAEG
ncbi:MAG: hypothetical protein SGI73_20630 [Chloroflexota bacterium]|nr:hypothetical protein [Chloroflexota bacterium]